jgi:hypothetical protein
MPHASRLTRAGAYLSSRHQILGGWHFVHPPLSGVSPQQTPLFLQEIRGQLIAQQLALVNKPLILLTVLLTKWSV